MLLSEGQFCLSLGGFVNMSSLKIHTSLLTEQSWKEKNTKNCMVTELKRRKSNGEQNLVIRNNTIVTITRHSQPSILILTLVIRVPDDIFVHSVSNPVLNSHQHSSHDSNATLNSNFNGTQPLRLIFLIFKALYRNVSLLLYCLLNMILML